MSVQISVIGGNKDSDEYKAALKLKTIIQKSIPHSVIGEIVLYASATLIGQAVKDVDLFMLGTLQNYDVNLEFINGEGKRVKEKVEVSSFCTTIEVKSHGIEGVSRVGTDFYVKYGKTKHCVTEQSNRQKIAAMNFFNRTFSFSPYITNLIWFTEVTSEDLSDLLRVETKEMLANVLGQEFDFPEMLQLLLWQKAPYKVGTKYRFDSNYGNCTLANMQKALNMFAKVKESMGNLTRQRIEMISRKGLSANEIVPKNGKMSICRGRAGTGKTVSLIQTAIKLVDEEYARVLILTYNKALVSDIRRLFALSELPDLFEENCVHIMTMHSYFYRLISTCLYNGKLSGESFIDEYDKYINEIIDFLNDKDALDYVREMVENDCFLNWEYVLIDEAQDLTQNEQKLFVLLFKKEGIIVADGGHQFVRNIEVCNWSAIKERENIKLKYCLRQKNNIVKFINIFFKEYSGTDKRILSSEKLPGGKIIIISNKDEMFSVIKKEKRELECVGNIAYDMLFLVPHSLVNKNASASFTMTNQFEANNIFIWDGTDEVNRENYTIQSDEVRVLQYDSSRGLEGWTVCCMEIDKFVQLKKAEYHGKKNPLLLQSAEDDLKNYLDDWLMIALTRAIDTLIITIDNPLSREGIVLKKMSTDYPDYITWI